VLRLPANRGKGEALARGAAAAAGEVLVFLDADLGASAAEGWRLLGPLREGGAHMVVAVLPPPERASGPVLAVRLARGGHRAPDRPQPAGTPERPAGPAPRGAGRDLKGWRPWRTA